MKVAICLTGYMLGMGVLIFACLCFIAPDVIKEWINMGDELVEVLTPPIDIEKAGGALASLLALGTLALGLFIFVTGPTK